jgi:hypothetical protein
MARTVGGGRAVIGIFTCWKCSIGLSYFGFSLGSAPD